MSQIIAAVSTGNVVSAIGIIRMTGAGCAAVADKVFTRMNGKSLGLLKSCTSFREILALGCLAGWWEIPTDNVFNLPLLNEDSITEADIRQAAKGIRFQPPAA